MHELAVTQSILKIALRHGEQAGAARITHIHIVMGELSTNVDDSVQFYWDMIAQDTMAQGAMLHFRRVEAQLQCMACFEKFRPAPGEFRCPRCGSVGAKIISGEEFYVESIDVEQEQAS